MTLPLNLSVLLPSLQLADLFTEPMDFLAVWLLFGWVLLRFSRQASGQGDHAVTDHRHREQRTHPRRHQGLELVLIGAALYVLLRYWHNR